MQHLKKDCTCASLQPENADKLLEWIQKQVMVPWDSHFLFFLHKMVQHFIAYMNAPIEG
jgi:hypothetical protein